MKEIDADDYALLQSNLTDLLPKLNAEEQQILTRRFGLNGEPALTLEELSTQLNVPLDKIREAEKKALTLMKA